MSSRCALLWVVNDSGLTIKCSGHFIEDTYVHPGTGGEPLHLHESFVTAGGPGHAPQTLTVLVEKRLTSNHLPWWRPVNIELEAASTAVATALFPNAYYDYNDFNGSIFRPPSLWYIMGSINGSVFRSPSPITYREKPLRTFLFCSFA